MPAASNCLLCRKPAESRTSDGRFAFCRDCCRSKLVPLLKGALGQDELLRAVNALATTGGGGKPMVTAADADKINRLLRGAEMSRGTGRPATPRRRPTVAEQRLAVGRAAAKQAGQVLECDIPALVRKARLNTGGTTAAELSTVASGTAKPAGTGKPTSAPVKRLPATRQPTRSEIMERVRKAGFDT
jgi:hypothetical protein